MRHAEATCAWLSPSAIRASRNSAPMSRRNRSPNRLPCSKARIAAPMAEFWRATVRYQLPRCRAVRAIRRMFGQANKRNQYLKLRTHGNGKSVVLVRAAERVGRDCLIQEPKGVGSISGSVASKRGIRLVGSTRRPLGQNAGQADLQQARPQWPAGKRGIAGHARTSRQYRPLKERV